VWCQRKRNVHTSAHCDAAVEVASEIWWRWGARHDQGGDRIGNKIEIAQRFEGLDSVLLPAKPALWGFGSRFWVIWAPLSRCRRPATAEIDKYADLPHGQQEVETLWWQQRLWSTRARRQRRRSPTCRCMRARSRGVSLAQVCPARDEGVCRGSRFHPIRRSRAPYSLARGDTGAFWAGIRGRF
jgi:hypothetical protein